MCCHDWRVANDEMCAAIYTRSLARSLAVAAVSEATLFYACPGSTIIELTTRKYMRQLIIEASSQF